MKLRLTVAAAAMLAPSFLASAGELSSTLKLTNDYDFRGTTLSGEDPAFQASLDYFDDSGFYIGAFASTGIDFADCCEESNELDFYGGYTWETGNGIAWDAALLYYTYPGTDTDLDYAEAYIGGSYEAFTGRLWYTNDVYALGDSGYYLDANYDIPLPKDITMTLHLGYTGGDAWDDAGNANAVGEAYVDYSIGVARTVGNFDLELKYSNTTIGDDWKVESGPFANQARFIFTISTTLPWAE